MKSWLKDRTRASNDEGVALVVVVIVMLVGAVIVSTIAASVLVTMRLNVANRGTTQAFVAAESGRDAMLAALMANPCAPHVDDSANPHYENVRYLVGTDAAHLASGCVISTSGSVIQITSTGVSTSGSTTVVSLYQLLATYDNQPGGSLSYFAGSFKLTQSLYKGDIVIRDGDYQCNSTSTIDGDLWVPHGGVDLSSRCDITGNIYARDAISITAANEQVGTVGKSGTGNVVSERGPIYIKSTGGVITGDVLGGGNSAQGYPGNVGLDAGTVNGTVRAYGAYTSKPQGKVLGAAPSQNVRPTPAVFPVALEDVYKMTNWLDLGSDSSVWGTDVQWVTVPNTTAACNADRILQLSAPLTTGHTRYGFDYRACTTNVSVTLGGGTVKHDAVFLVPASVNMHVNVTGNISITGASSTPQLFFIHADLAPTTAGPQCHTGSTQSDSLDLPNGGTVSPYLMIYSPCGMDKNSVPKNGQTYNGQYYSADNTPTGQTSHWVQPTFMCQPMQWSPLIKLGCYISDAGTGDNGTLEPHIQAPSFVSQIENPPSP